jgi:hypothetical protein
VNCNLTMQYKDSTLAVPILAVRKESEMPRSPLKMPGFGEVVAINVK